MARVVMVLGFLLGMGLAIPVAYAQPAPSATSSAAARIAEKRQALQDRHDEAVLDAAATAPPLTFYDLVGTLVAWVALMQLLSIVVERAVSLTKWARVLARRRSLQSVLGTRKLEILTYDVPQLSNLIVLLGAKVPEGTNGEPADRATVFKALVDVDDASEVDLSRREVKLRSLALVFGLGAAFLLQMDTIALLRPILPHGIPDVPAIGMALSGIASAAGSAFWNDFLDKLTNWKKGAKDAGATA